MTDEILRRAIKVCIENAHSAGRLTKGNASLASALEYANGVILPIVEARIEQGIEEAWRASRQPVPGDAP